MDNKKIGIFIAIQRKQKGMTQKQLAEKLGVTNKAISKWETGEGYPDITTVPALAEILEVTTDELLSGKVINDIKKNIQLENTEELSEDVMNKGILKFKKFSFISQGIALFGIILDLIFWYEYKNSISILIGNSIIIMSVIIWLISYYILRDKIRKYNILYPNSQVGLKKIAIRPLIISLWIWLILPIRLMIFLFNKINIKNVFYYLVLDKFGLMGLDIIIILGYILALSILTLIIKKRFRESVNFRS